jgi:hypothetical protein
MNQLGMYHICTWKQLGIFCIAILISTSKNAMSFITYVFSSTKFEKTAEQILPGSKGGGEEREEPGAGGRNGPNNICTCE